MVTLGNDTTGTFSSKNAGPSISVSTAMSISGTDSGNYTLTQPVGLAANISAAVLNLAGTRVYDAGTDAAATLFGSNGTLTGVNGETLTLSGTGTLNGKNVGSEGFASLTGFSLAGNGSTMASNYTLTGGTDSVAITPLAITVAATGANKVYDATTNDPGLTLASAGVVPGDVVSFSDTAATFATKNAGTGITVTASGISDSGADARNYTLINTTATSTAAITPLAITVAATGANKVYDATTNDPGLTLASAGVVPGDVVSFSDTAATFATKNAGTGITVTASGISDSGADAGNYTFNSSATTAANISPAVLNLAGTRVYDAGTDAAATLFGSSGVLTGVNGEALTLSGTGTLNGKDVGSEGFASLSGFSLTGNGSAMASNYTLVGGTDSVAITPLAVTVAATAANKVYDGTTADPGLTLASTGVLAGDVVSFADTAATFATKNAGTGITVTASGISDSGADAANYTLENTAATSTAAITPKVITVSAAGSNKVYDGNTGDDVALASSGIVSGDNVALVDTSANFATSTVANDKPVTVSGVKIVGQDAGNYLLASNTAATEANITPSAGIQNTAVAVDYLEASPDAIATPYGVAPSNSPGQLTGNQMVVHRSVEPNEARRDFKPGLELQILDGGVRMPAGAQ